MHFAHHRHALFLACIKCIHIISPAYQFNENAHSLNYFFGEFLCASLSPQLKLEACAEFVHWHMLSPCHIHCYIMLVKEGLVLKWKDDCMVCILYFLWTEQTFVLLPRASYEATPSGWSPYQRLSWKVRMRMSSSTNEEFYLVSGQKCFGSFKETMMGQKCFGNESFRETIWWWGWFISGVWAGTLWAWKFWSDSMFLLLLLSSSANSPPHPYQVSIDLFCKDNIACMPW